MHAGTGHRDLPGVTAEEPVDADADLAVWMTSLPVTAVMTSLNDAIFSPPATIGPLMSALSLPLNTSVIMDQVIVTDGVCDAAVVIEAVGPPGTSRPG